MDYTKLKRYLKITWDDEDEDLLEIVVRGKAYIDGKAGVNLDYTNDQEVIQLLLDYGRYVYNHSFELFETNFQREIFNLTLREGINSHAEEDSETST
jgi:hypothetical protein